MKHVSVRKQRRIDGAVERQELRAKRSPEDQLKRLDALLGEGVGAVKERAKLQKLINKEA
jgi:hypothetical protein